MRSTKQLLGSSMREFQTFIILIFLLLRGLQAFIFVCFGMLCHVLQTECRFNNAVKFMEGWSASWDCCFSLRCKFIFRQIRITSSDHLKQRIKNTQTFATFQVSTRYSHNWWHVTVCYLVGGSLISKVQEIYDNQVSSIYLYLAFLYIRLDFF